MRTKSQQLCILLTKRRYAMNAIKTHYDDLPETIKIPDEFVHKKGEIIIIIDEDIQNKKKKKLSDFFGSIPDFPERFSQGEYEDRIVL